MALTLGTINDTLSPKIETADTNITTSLEALGTDPSPVEMLKMQREIATLTIMIDIQATLTKSLGDSIKGIVQKSG